MGRLFDATTMMGHDNQGHAQEFQIGSEGPESAESATSDDDQGRAQRFPIGSDGSESAEIATPLADLEDVVTDSVKHALNVCSNGLNRNKQECANLLIDMKCDDVKESVKSVMEKLYEKFSDDEMRDFLNKHDSELGGEQKRQKVVHSLCKIAACAFNTANDDVRNKFPSLLLPQMRVVLGEPPAAAPDAGEPAAAALDAGEPAAAALDAGEPAAAATGADRSFHEKHSLVIIIVLLVVIAALALALGLAILPRDVKRYRGR